MENETKKCKYCQSDIPKKAKICPNCRKKQGGKGKIIALVIVILIIIIAIASCFGSGGNSSETQRQSDANGNVTTENTGKSSGESQDAPKEDDLSQAVQVVKEYTFKDSIGWYTYHFYVIQNTSDKTVDISTSSVAYGTDGAVISSDDSDFYALGSGCTSIMYEAFETSADIDHYDTKWKVSKSYYTSVIQDLSYVQNDVEDGAVFQVTNNGTEAAEFVEGYALFFSGDQLVGFNSTYFTNDNSEINPGETISEQFSEYDSFDRIEFYLDGRR